jgi:CheY-like chemotaxis protein
LIVDDVDDGREMLAEYLEFRGFQVRQAPTATEGLAMARRNLPRIILMDLSLPHMDGWEATRVLKSDPATQDVTSWRSQPGRS